VNKCFITDKNLYFFFLISIEAYLPSLFIGLSEDAGKFHLQPINVHRVLSLSLYLCLFLRGGIVLIKFSKER